MFIFFPVNIPHHILNKKSRIHIFYPIHVFDMFFIFFQILAYTICKK